MPKRSAMLRRNPQTPCIAGRTRLAYAPGRTRDELQREIEGSRREAVDVAEAIDALYGAGLIHVSGELITPTRAARLMDELRL